MDSLASYRNVSVGKKPSRTVTIARSLGWMSLASGISLLAAPSLIGQLARLRRARRGGMLRTVGAGELIAGTALLLGARQLWRRRARVPEPLVAAETINRPPDEVYTFFRRLENLPLFMEHLESVSQMGRFSHWVARLPLGGRLIWDAELTLDEPGEQIGWQTAAGSPLAHQGLVTFSRAPGRDATEVRVQMELGIAGKPISASLARLFARPQIKGDLRRFKQVMETGEVVHSDASIHPGRHPARPSAEGARGIRERMAAIRAAGQKGRVS